MKIFIIPNYIKKNTGEMLNRLTDMLSSANCDMYIMPEQSFEDEEHIQCFYFSMLTEERKEIDELKNSDIIISLGGDGTMMRAAHLGAKFQIPVLGINTGNLGFLTQVEPEDLEYYIDKLLKGKYDISYRSGISVYLDKSEKPCIDFAVNEVVFRKNESYNVIDFKIFSDNFCIDSCRADGIIFSSATGSTAYNLSAGGVVVDPLLNVINMVPICPHTMQSKPMIFSDKREIRFISETNDIILIADGAEKIIVKKGTSIRVVGSDKRVGFINFKDKEFFQILSEKIKQRG